MQVRKRTQLKNLYIFFEKSFLNALMLVIP